MLNKKALLLFVIFITIIFGHRVNFMSRVFNYVEI